MSVYADTSILVSYYLSDANSTRANALMSSLHETLIFTRLHRLEFANALELGAFRGHYSRSQVDQSWNDLLTGIRDGRLKKRLLIGHRRFGSQRRFRVNFQQGSVPEALICFMSRPLNY